MPRVKAVPTQQPTIVNQEIATKKAIQWLKLAPVAVEGLAGDQTTFAVACRVKDFGVNEDTCVEFVARQFPELCESRKKKNGQLDVYIRGKILKKFSIDIQDDSGESLSTAD
jgi:hypothetical protein